MVSGRRVATFLCLRELREQFGRYKKIHTVTLAKRWLTSADVSHTHQHKISASAGFSP
jgi:hypothetical protein